MHRAILAIAAALPLFSQGAPCDPELEGRVNAKDDDRYMKRGNRCEGVYRDPVNADNGRLWVASFTTERASSPPWPATLALQWPRYENSGVTLQAYSLRPQLFYRLDAPLPGNAGPFQWSTGMVAKYLPPGEVGLVAWTTTTAVRNRPERVYLPLSTSAKLTPPYKLIMVSTVDVTSVSLLVSPVGEKPIRERQRLPVGPLMRGQPFPVTLPTLPRAGLYRVEVVAQARNQGSVISPPFLIYHGGQ